MLTAMPAPKTRTSVSLTEKVTVDTQQVDVAVEGLNVTAIPGPFSVHLLRDGKRIASRAFYQPSGPAPTGDGAAPRARVDFMMPIGEVARRELSIEIEPLDPNHRELVSSGALGRPTLSVYLVLELHAKPRS